MSVKEFLDKLEKNHFDYIQCDEKEICFNLASYDVFDFFEKSKHYITFELIYKLYSSGYSQMDTKIALVKFYLKHMKYERYEMMYLIKLRPLILHEIKDHLPLQELKNLIHILDNKNNQLRSMFNLEKWIHKDNALARDFLMDYIWFYKNEHSSRNEMKKRFDLFKRGDIFDILATKDPHDPFFCLLSKFFETFRYTPRERKKMYFLNPSIHLKEFVSEDFDFQDHLDMMLIRKEGQYLYQLPRDIRIKLLSHLSEENMDLLNDYPIIRSQYVDQMIRFPSLLKNQELIGKYMKYMPALLLLDEQVIKRIAQIVPYPIFLESLLSLGVSKVLTNQYVFGKKVSMEDIDLAIQDIHPYEQFQFLSHVPYDTELSSFFIEIVHKISPFETTYAFPISIDPMILKMELVFQQLDQCTLQNQLEKWVDSFQGIGYQKCILQWLYEKKIVSYENMIPLIKKVLQLPVKASFQEMQSAYRKYPIYRHLFNIFNESVQILHGQFYGLSFQYHLLSDQIMVKGTQHFELKKLEPIRDLIKEKIFQKIQNLIPISNQLFFEPLNDVLSNRN